jgi:hypothetical protein
LAPDSTHGAPESRFIAPQQRFVTRTADPRVLAADAVRAEAAVTRV